VSCRPGPGYDPNQRARNRAAAATRLSHARPPSAPPTPQGPGVADQLLDGTGYALLLTSGTQPITAATLDVYGTVGVGGAALGAGHGHDPGERGWGSGLEVAKRAECCGRQRCVRGRAST
jgi:hypothetical protein